MKIQNLLSQKCILSGMTLGGMIANQCSKQENYPLIVAMVAKVANPVLSNICHWDFYRAHELLEHLKNNRTVTVSSLSESHINFVMMSRAFIAEGDNAEFIVRQTVKVNSYEQLEYEVQDVALISKAFNSLDSVERLKGQLELLTRPILPKDIDTQPLIREVISYFKSMCIFDQRSETASEINKWKEKLTAILDRYHSLEIALLLALTGHIDKDMLAPALQQIQNTQGPNHSDICFLFGKLFWEGKNGIKRNEFLGLNCLEYANEVAPNNFEILCELGNVYLEGGVKTQKNPQKAFSYFKAAIAVAPENPDYLYRLAARINQSLNQHDMFRFLRRALLVQAHRLDPKNEKIAAALTEDYLYEYITVAPANPKE